MYSMFAFVGGGFILYLFKIFLDNNEDLMIHEESNSRQRSRRPKFKSGSGLNVTNVKNADKSESKRKSEVKDNDALTGDEVDQRIIHALYDKHAYKSDEFEGLITSTGLDALDVYQGLRSILQYNDDVSDEFINIVNQTSEIHMIGHNIPHTIHRDMIVYEVIDPNTIRIKIEGYDIDMDFYEFKGIRHIKGLRYHIDNGLILGYNAFLG